jgi:hypothetical protein
MAIMKSFFTRVPDRALTFIPGEPDWGGLTYPLEMTRPAGVFDRLFYYGTYWIFKDKATKPSIATIILSGGRVYYLTSITDRNGNAVTLDVDLSNGVVRTITDLQAVPSPELHGDLCTRIDLPSGSSVSCLLNTTHRPG